MRRTFLFDAFFRAAKTTFCELLTTKVMSFSTGAPPPGACKADTQNNGYAREIYCFICRQHAFWARLTSALRERVPVDVLHRAVFCGPSPRLPGDPQVPK